MCISSEQGHFVFIVKRVLCQSKNDAMHFLKTSTRSVQKIPEFSLYTGLLHTRLVPQIIRLDHGIYLYRQYCYGQASLSLYRLSPLITVQKLNPKLSDLDI